MSDQSLSFESYHVGQEGTTITRTVAEADIISFACLTEDYNMPHVDRHAMETSMYGSRVAHGLLGSSIATGMLSLCAPHIIGRGVPESYFSGFEANYRGGLKLGDTIHVRWRVAETAPSHTHQGFGLVTTRFQVVTHEGVAVYDGTFSTLVRMGSAKGAELKLLPGTPWPVMPSASGQARVPEADNSPADDVKETAGRTITETDIVNYAGLTGDYDPRYVDAEFARGSMFGERIAPGMLAFTVAFGRWTSARFALGGLEPPPPDTAAAGTRADTGTTVDSGTMVAGHLNDTASFLAPVKIGDTIRCRYKALATRASKSRPGLTLTTTGLQIVNQRDEVVQEGSTIMLG
ncbi:MAG: MaoC/PaaZ C-terminal domain-containing protein [Desulfobacterales bacterium]